MAANTIQLGDMYGQFTRYAWRLEARDHYDVEGESAEQLAAFMRTGIPNRRTPDDDEWLAGIVAATRRGAQFGRVRLVGRPITDYTKYEVACYPDNIAAGEDVQVVERSWLANPSETYPDFWLFDDETVFVQHYDEEGHYLGAEQANDVEQFLEIRRELTTLSVSLAAYLARCGNEFNAVPAVPGMLGDLNWVNSAAFEDGSSGEVDPTPLARLIYAALGISGDLNEALQAIANDAGDGPIHIVHLLFACEYTARCAGSTLARNPVGSPGAKAFMLAADAGHIVPRVTKILRDEGFQAATAAVSAMTPSERASLIDILVDFWAVPMLALHRDIDEEEVRG